MQNKTLKFVTEKSFSNPKDYFMAHILIVNSMEEGNKLSLKEVEVLAAFLALDPAITLGDVLNPQARRMVKQELQMSSASLTNHLKALSLKGAFETLENLGRHAFARQYRPSREQQNYVITITNEKGEQ